MVINFYEMKENELKTHEASVGSGYFLTEPMMLENLKIIGEDGNYSINV